MDVNQLFAIFTADPEVTTKTALRFFHFIGLALGLGGAIVLDLMLLRFFLRGKIISETFGIFNFASKIVDTGLRLLWITGLGFLFFYALTNPQLLANPKVHAKLVIVVILTVNGYFIHSVILPSVKAQIGKSLFTDVSPVRRSIFITSGAISAVSWFTPVALGAFSQLNFSVPAFVILSVYLALIASAAIGMHLLILTIGKIADPTEAEPAMNYAWLEKAISADVPRPAYQMGVKVDEPVVQTDRDGQVKRRLIVKPRLAAALRDNAQEQDVPMPIHAA